MKIVIDIPEEYYNLLKGFDDEKCSMDMLLLKNGTPLPKGHGRIIDESQIRSVTICCDEERIDGWRLRNEYVGSTDAPTIVEADKAESEDKV